MSMTVSGLAKAAREAKAAGADAWITDASYGRGLGTLRFRATPTGAATFYFRFTDAKGKQDHIALGAYDESGVAGLALRDARAKAGELSKLLQDGRRDLRGHLAHEAAERAARIEEAARVRAEAERMDKSGSLEKLVDGYIAHQERRGKQSAGDARTALKRHVVDAHPEIAAMRANMVTQQDAAKIIAAIVNAGHGRTAAKVRSYAAAAFGLALAAQAGDPTIHPDLHGFALVGNPFAAVPTKGLAAFNRARDRHLNESELRAFLLALDAREGVARDAVMLSILLGGQRPAQLVRVKPSDVDLDAATVTLHDSKGARQTPRVHVLPMPKRAREIVARLMEDRSDKPYLFSSYESGRVAIRSESMSAVVVEIRDAMIAEKTCAESFDLRDLRRTCETMLARMGITREVRAQLLSHGLGGVQQRHYDRHAYMDEKRAALESWGRKVANLMRPEPPSKVVKLHREARR